MIEVIALDGSHKRIGERFGEIHKKFCRENNLPIFRHPSNETVRLAKKIEKFIKNVHPLLLDEIEGISISTGIAYEIVLSNIVFCGCSSYSTACQAVGLVNKGRTLLVLNYEPPLINKELIIKVRTYYKLGPDKSYRSIIGSDCYLYPTDGINEKGLAIVTTKVSNKIKGLGLSPFLMNRIILDRCKDANEAIELMRKGPHMMEWNFLIGDQRKIVLIETHPPSRILLKEVDKFLVLGNFFWSKPISSKLRRAILLEEKLKKLNNVDINSIIETMKDREVFNSEKSFNIAAYDMRAKKALICNNKVLFLQL
ncbi:C45 family peptidase [Candidatus Methanodesulfokora washburnensis]|jgi:predicted choloylglycine hydrolase|uniref:Peptidase C45 hydrolase domain-containing protein n=1 Tax=Candidatus Methanodesulfokora washburnensis TaxID=2478471 RepID=A0A429GVY4_9CREN|nr:C45 family peptidase [Candidatus Methanodesulfokores washburnensis]RSN78088.1 hypothetical protein D6D85_01510 [Candidatus Methanodesulfokores washburnensis]